MSTFLATEVTPRLKFLLLQPSAMLFDIALSKNGFGDKLSLHTKRRSREEEGRIWTSLISYCCTVVCSLWDLHAGSFKSHPNGLPHSHMLSEVL